MEERKNELSLEEVRKQINRPDASDEEIEEIIASIRELTEIVYISWEHLVETGQLDNHLEEIRRKRESNPNKTDLQ